MSRRRIKKPPTWAAALLLLLATGFAVAGFPYLVAGEAAKRPPQEQVPIHLDLPPNTILADLKSGRVDEVVDGDTIDVIVDGNKHLRVRYFGVDTPERGQKCFREATDRNAALVGTHVLLLPDHRELDRYGRTLRYIFTTDGVSIDATLVAEGFGHAWRTDGRYKDQIIALETEAQAANRGCLWK